MEVNGPLIAVTGHRPDKLGGYDRDTFDWLRYYADRVLAEIKPSGVITGMAQGWDQAVASAAMLKHVPFYAYVPCTGQETVWPEPAQIRYRSLLKRAADVIVVTPGSYTPHAMHARNEAMVDALPDTGKLVALYDGSPTGGTAACVRYAVRTGVTIVNVWDGWVAFKRERELERKRKSPLSS